METGGHPVAYGDWLHAPGKPTVLIYGHFDVQPVDPVELWDSPPFEPTLYDGKVRAHGASDDKGGMYTIQATEALLNQGRALFPLMSSTSLRGGREIGSPTLPDFIEANKAKFACDMVLSSDGGQWSETEPALMVGLHGLSALQIDVVGPDHDMHSGGVGGAIQNPISTLVKILDSIRADDGKILVDGFYANVRELSDEDRQFLKDIPYDEAEYMAEMGLNGLYGEPGFSTMERIWARPTLEVNGIWGGFQGAGTTVIPSVAHARITCRLVAPCGPRMACSRRLESHCHPHARRRAGDCDAQQEHGAGLSHAVGPSGQHCARDVLAKCTGAIPTIRGRAAAFLSARSFSTAWAFTQ